MGILTNVIFRGTLIIFVLSLTGTLVFSFLYLKRRGDNAQLSVLSDGAQGVSSDQITYAYADKTVKDVSDISDLMPNGWRRHDYHRYGITDDEISYWSLDEPGAPEPYVASRMISEVMREQHQDEQYLAESSY